MQHHNSAVLWTGHGASLAVAMAAAETQRQQGQLAFAALPNVAVLGARHHHISRSGRLPEASHPDMLICEAGIPAHPDLQHLWIPRSGHASDWMPLSWVMTASQTLSAWLDCSVLVPPWRMLPPLQTPVLFACDHGGSAVAQLFAALRSKTPELTADGLATSELGHGWHARLYQEGGTVLHLTPDPAPTLTDWLTHHAPQARHHTIPVPVGALPTLAVAACVLSDLAQRAGVDLCRSRIPAASDTLRGVR